MEKRLSCYFYIAFASRFQKALLACDIDHMSLEHSSNIFAVLKLGELPPPPSGRHTVVVVLVQVRVGNIDYFTGKKIAIIALNAQELPNFLTIVVIVVIIIVIVIVIILKIENSKS